MQPVGMRARLSRECEPGRYPEVLGATGSASFSRITPAFSIEVPEHRADMPSITPVAHAAPLGSCNHGNRSKFIPKNR